MSEKAIVLLMPEAATPQRWSAFLLSRCTMFFSEHSFFRLFFLFPVRRLIGSSHVAVQQSTVMTVMTVG